MRQHKDSGRNVDDSRPKPCRPSHEPPTDLALAQKLSHITTYWRMTMTKAALLFVTSVAAVMGFWLVQASYAADTKLSDADQKFLKEADEIGMTEVQLGKLAQDHAATQPVMRFGQRMVRDHSRMGNELRDLAKSKGVTLPDKLDKKHQKMVDQMSS